MSFVVSAQQLNEMRQSSEEVVIIDVRADLLDPQAGFLEYATDHIPGAYYLDLETDLSGEVKKHGGNHPLPDIKTFVEKIRTFGITNDSDVVVYDKGGDMFAPRAWWLFRYLGHQRVFVLDGGYRAWVNQGYDVTSVIPEKKHGTFRAHVEHQRVVNIAEVKERGENSVLIDSRTWERYIGSEEPLYERAGHIPGAVNYDWQAVFTEEGFLKETGDLKDHFQALQEAETIIVSCGSGVSACANILALEALGYKQVKLYPGSFSDWISYPENKVKIGDEP